MTKAKWVAAGIACVALIVVIVPVYYVFVANPKVARTLLDDPHGATARKVMLLTLPSGKTIPVNYLRDGRDVYAAADFTWWKEIRGEGGRGSVLVRGELLDGHMRAVEDDPELRESVFARLRPTAPRWAGVLVVVRLDEGGE